jgi:deoxynucleoside triphosphate triphosphohydrolase SAMHD1
MNPEILDKKNKLISDLCTTVKTIDDVLYGAIQFSKFAIEIIDSLEFQRLRKMHQLGLAYYVFPNAVHTRFEHSLGTYFQSKEITKRLADVTPVSEMNDYLRNIPELYDYIEKNYKEKKCDFDKYLQELVNIAALCHDLGHGPFSHLFDDIFISNSELKYHENAQHEKRSQLLVELIIKRSPYLASRISNEHIKLIQNIIDPPKNIKGFIFQIVSNNSNSLDVDKFDYITRDMIVIGKKTSFDYKRLITQAVISNNMIAYPKDCAFDIYQLFNMRHTMHRQIYNHPGVVSANLMMSDMMKQINQTLHITDSIKDMNLFCKFTDSFIVQYPEYLEICNNNIDDKNYDINNKIIDISNKFKSHKFYYLIFAFVLEEPVPFDKNDIFKEYPQYLDDIIIFTSIVGFVGGNKPNPLDNIYLYNDIKYSNDKIHYIGNTIQKNKHGITNLISNKYQEHLYMVFYKKNDEHSRKNIVPKLEEHFKNYIASYLQQYVINIIKI